jgi:hypothetical protein
VLLLSSPLISTLIAFYMWKRGRVEELRPGRDGKVRTVILRTQDGGRLVSPVQLVIPLEVDQGGEDVEDVT